MFKATSWLRDVGRQGRRVSEMFVASIQRSAWTSTPHVRRVRVTMHPDRADELRPEDAARLAEEPLVILVENRNSDGAFLERVVQELDKQLHGHWRRPGKPIRLDSVGGLGQMPDEVERRVQRERYRPRLVAIGESDPRRVERWSGRQRQRCRSESSTHMPEAGRPMQDHFFVVIECQRPVRVCLLRGRRQLHEAQLGTQTRNVPQNGRPNTPPSPPYRTTE